MSMERIAQERVQEPLLNEKVVKQRIIEIEIASAVGPEPWDVTTTEGKAPPYGYLKAGRILVGPPLAPLAGLAWSAERGKPYVHHIWVDPEARGRGLSRLLFDLYREDVSKRLVVAGPFTAAGRAAAKAAKAKLINDGE